MTPEQIRSQFIDYFKQREHTIVPSASVVPTDDPTLLFTNAGMNQFKDVFLGTGTRDYARAVDSQKCIRAGGKHNDLEEVGRDTYHHTFFEMLGNWSFGDYFKAEAIGWAWDLLTNVWGLPKNRLYATVFKGDPTDGLEGDDHAEQLWLGLTDIDPAHISRWAKEDNFWEMGETGPCGPCSEIHIDLTPDCSGGAMVNAGSPQVIELWNLVFIQYNRNPDGSLNPLAKQHVDTGMGFERVSVVLKHLDALRNQKPCSFSNYGTELFVPLIQQLETLSGYRYGVKASGVETDARYDAGGIDEIADVACRVIVDHARMLAFAMADGGLPSNEGRGYVVRRVLRRAARFGRQHLDLHQPFIHKLIPSLVDRMGEAYPELAANADRVTGLILDEEESFGRTLDRGIQLFNQAADKVTADRSNTIEPADAFRLYDTFGFPVDLTVQMAAERQLTVDTEGFERLMDEARQKARAAAKGHATVAFDGELPRTADGMKYLGEQGRGRVLGWVVDNALITDGRLSPGSEVGLVLDQTCFYGEQGGQVGDAGEICTETGRFVVATTQVLGDGIVHMGQVADGVIEPGQAGELAVDADRIRTKSNHTATHLMHKALRQCLGDHAVQRGSLVEPDRLRFDFDHSEAVSAEQLAQIERMVNAMIWADHPVRWYEKPREQAMRLDGLVAMFGEKYGDVVRVVEIGDGVSLELCGGTHVERTGQIGVFKIVGEESVARGVRRISAVTGPGALAYIQNLDAMTRRVAVALNVSVEDVPARVEALQRDLRDARKSARSGQAADMQSLRQQLLDQADKTDGPVVIVSEVPAVPVDQIRDAVDWLRTKIGSAAVVLGSKQGGGKVILVAGATSDVVKAGVHAGNLIREIAPLVGGGGGGKPDLAQAGGKNADGLPGALTKAKALLDAQLGKDG